ncbi:cupin domain-containing protein [Flexithrix dorotheae]|uniref:cupin domain-containing protein n=1 Tax=Flexithrix dorotheae TaxID=70993 RepID=UPI001B7FAE56|nr:cupin domain-containing protein [Flexithrix dorotheae]
MKLFSILIFLFLTTSMCTPPKQGKITRKTLLDVSFPQRNVSLIKIVEVELPVGQKAPIHQHPCPVLGQIISGTCLMEVEGEESRVLQAGEAFYEPAGRPIIHFDNLSEEEPLKFVAYYLTNGERNLIEMLEVKKR